MTKQRLYLYDTTLRDGEQSPGATMTSDRVGTMIDRSGRSAIDGAYTSSSSMSQWAVTNPWGQNGMPHSSCRASS